MLEHTEIEFKTLISKAKYEELLDKFNLRNNVYQQTNFYFDTKTHELLENKKIIRIRQKPSTIKLTLKEALESGDNIEKNIMIDSMIKEKLMSDGFNTNEYFKNLNFDVHYITKLVNNRAKTAYLSGTLFLDECIYNDQIDYEIEYEATSHFIGFDEWNQLLKECGVLEVETKKKTKRAFDSLK